MAAKFTAADMTGTSVGGSAASSWNKKTLSDACNEIVQRLKASGHSEATSENFYGDLLKHVNRFSHRYYQNTINRSEDILIHKRCLELAKDAQEQPIIHVNQIQPNSEIEEKVTRITIATNNGPELFSIVLNAFDAIGLAWKEFYTYKTSDGYKLGVFILSGCEYETEQLKKILENELSKFEILEGAELPQIQKHDVDTEQFLGLSMTCVQFVFYLIVSLAAAYVLIDGVCLMYGAPEEADILGLAVPIGKKLIGKAPFLGVVVVLLTLLEVVERPMVKAKVLIISWLIVCLILGVSLPFMEVKEAAIKDKATVIFFTLVAALAVRVNLDDP